MENMLSDASNFALSRYNTGGTPRSSMLEEKNNIFIKLSEAKNLSKLVWWTDEDKVSGGYGWNVHNGTVTRLQISVTTESVENAAALASLDENKWSVQTKGDAKGKDIDVRFDSNENNNASENPYEANNTTVAHDIDLSKYFENVPENITGVRIEVLNTAGTYTPKLDGESELKDERDTYINGREVYAYEGETKLEGLTAHVDFATQSGCEASKLVDGTISAQSKMSSLLDTSTDAANSPQKHDYGKYFANNNIYFDIGETKTLGRLTYVPGVQNGSVRRCNIYTSNAALTGNQGVEDITDWNLVYTNIPGEPAEGEEEDMSGDWSAYDPALSAVGNSKIANFTSFSEARYVRMEVINTQTPGRDTENKWINAGHIYIYEAEPVYTGVEQNVALGTVAGGSTTIKCYTGNAGGPNGVSGAGSDAQGPNLIIDGVDINNNYWGGRNELRDRVDHANYVVLDLGGNVTDLSSIKLTWQAKAWATDYKIETSDVCTQDGDITGDIAPTDVPSEGWELVKEVSRSDVNSAIDPDVWNAEDLEMTTLSRYVRITMLRTNSNGAGLPHGALREIEIYGIKETGTLATIALDSEDPVYKGTLRRPATPMSERYHIDGDIDDYEGYEWYKGDQKLDKRTATFEAGTYKLEVKVATKLLIADMIQATIGGEQAKVTVDPDKNAAGETVLTVSREYTIESPEAAKAALSAYLETADVKAAYETGNRNDDGELIYRISTWEAFDAAYRKAQGMLELVPGMPDPDDPDAEVPKVEVWYLKSEYEGALADVTNTFGKLRKRGQGEPIDTTKDVPDVTIIAPVAGKEAAYAALTNPGEIENENLALVKERDHSKNYFRVDDQGYIHGRVTAPNTDAKNAVFNISGDTKFLIKFTAKPKNIGNERESLIGKFNKGYGMQILPAGGANNSSSDHDQLIVYGYHNANDWPQTGYLIPDDNWYDQDHEIVAIFNGGYFHLFVDGVAGTEVRKVTATGEPLSRTLTLDNSAVFTIGYNLEPGNIKNPNNVDEDFQGGLKDVKMYIGSNCPQNFDTLLADGLNKDTFNTALENLLKDKTPDMTLTGDPSKYNVTATRWAIVEDDKEIPMAEGDTFEAYRDYKVTIEVSANDQYYFTEQNGILRTGAEDADILTDALVSSESEEVITLTHIFRSADKHPKDELCEYLEGIADELGVKTENDAPVNKDKDTGERKYTVAAWQTFTEAYNAAVTASQEDKKWGAENNAQSFADALSALQAAAETVKENEAGDACECTIGTVTLKSGKNIELTSASAEETLTAEYNVVSANCMKHSGNNLPEGYAEYTITEGDTFASIEGNTLTITGVGTIKVAATVTLKDGGHVVDTKTSDVPAVYTVTSETTDDVSDLESVLDGMDVYHEDEYTPESWKILQDAIKAANDLVEKVKGGDTIYVYEKEQAKEAITDAVSGLVKKGADSIQALKDLVTSIGANIKPEDYTVDSYNALVAIYNQAVEEVKKENPDAARCAELLSQLQKAQADLVTKAQDLANAKSEVSSAIAAADVVYNAGQKDYSADSWKAFTDAYNAAKNAPSNADAAELRKLAAALKAAQAALKAAAGLTNGYTQTIGSIQYKVISADKKTVMVFKGMKKKAKSVVIPATVKMNGISCKVVQIGASAFKGYTKAKKVTIGKNVTSIGKQAFANCKALKKIILKGKALRNNKSIKSKAFKGTKKKVKITWPKGMKKSQKNKLIKGFKKQGLKL